MKPNYNSSLIKLNQTTIWNGSAWSNGVPNKNMTADIQGVYNTTTHGNISCRNLILTSGSLTVNVNTIVKVYKNIQQQTGFTLTLTNGELALFDKDVDTTSVKLTISRALEYAMVRLDYRYLGDPISNKTVTTLAPGTLTNRISTFNSVANIYTTNYFFNAISIGVDVARSIFKPGLGFLIRVQNFYPTSPTIWTVSSNNLANAGKLNAGVIKVPFEQAINPPAEFPESYVSISNPYSASIDINKFLRANPFLDKDQLYYWLSSNAAPGAGNYQSNEYNSSVYISYFPKIKPFEGFIAVIPTGTTESEIIFTPDMMVIEEPFNLFSSYHLSLKQPGFNLPVGFCSYGYYKHPVDFRNVTRTLSSTAYRLQLNNGVATTNLLSSYENPDEINLKVAGTVGTLSIQLDNRKGIYTGLGFILEDRLLNVFHNLVAGPYSFTSALVNYEDRFYIKIQ
jgi:hypothetical protein